MSEMIDRPALTDAAEFEPWLEAVAVIAASHVMQRWVVLKQCGVDYAPFFERGDLYTHEKLFTDPSLQKALDLVVQGKSPMPTDTVRHILYDDNATDTDEALVFEGRRVCVARALQLHSHRVFLAVDGRPGSKRGTLRLAFKNFYI